MAEKIEQFSQKHVFIFSTLIFAVFMPVIWGILFPFTESLPKEWQWTIKYGLSAVLSLLFMNLCWKNRIFSFSCPHFLKNLFTVGLLGLIGAVGAFFFSLDTVDLTPSFSTILGYIFMNFAIAASEEIIFRGIILRSMLRAFKQKKNVLYTSKQKISGSVS